MMLLKIDNYVIVQLLLSCDLRYLHMAKIDAIVYIQYKTCTHAVYDFQTYTCVQKTHTM